MTGPIILASLSFVWALYIGWSTFDDHMSRVLAKPDHLRSFAVYGSVPAMVGFFIAFVWLCFVFTK